MTETPRPADDDGDDDDLETPEVEEVAGATQPDDPAELPLDEDDVG